MGGNGGLGKRTSIKPFNVYCMFFPPFYLILSLTVSLITSAAISINTSHIRTSPKKGYLRVTLCNPA